MSLKLRFGEYPDVMLGTLWRIEMNIYIFSQSLCLNEELQSIHYNIISYEFQ